MEINRKTYSWIIKLLKGKKLSSDDALEVADDICTLLEKETSNTNPIEWWTKEKVLQFNQMNWDKPLMTPDNSKVAPMMPEESKWPRKFKPYEKVAWGQVDGNWKFHPIQAWVWLGWVRNEKGKLVETA